MASRAEQIRGVVSNTVAFHRHGEEITHNPGGIVADAATVTAIWNETEVIRSTENGEQLQRSGELIVPSSVTLKVRDTWEIDGETWQTVRIMPKSQGGLKRAYLQLNDKSTRKGPGNLR